MQNLTSQCFLDAYKHLGKNTQLYDGLCAENGTGHGAGKKMANHRHETLASHLTARDAHTLYPFWMAKIMRQNDLTVCSYSLH